MTPTFSNKFYSLKFRMMALITIVLLVVVGLPVTLFVLQLDKNYYNFTTNMIETTSQVVYQFLYEGMMKNDSTLIQNNLEFLALDPSLNLVRIYRPGGMILFSSSQNEINKDISQLPEEVSFFKSTNGDIEAFQRRGNVYSHHHPIRIQQECAPCHTNVGELIAILDVHAAFTQSEHIYNVSKNIAIFGGGLIILILWILLNILYQSQVESRLQTIISGFKKISDRDFNFKIKMPGKHELALLAEKFNNMVDNLKTARQKEESFFLEKLERADRLVTLGEVAAEIAHEVNNPAGIILTRAECLKEDLLEADMNKEGIQDLDIIIRQTEKIAQTTRSILHYARKLPKSFSAIDLKEVIQHSIQILSPRINKVEVQMKLDLPSDPVIIWGNFNQMEQIFCNLINNSLDFMTPEKGAINIRLIRLNHGDKSKICQIIYHDNGSGIPVEFQDSIFSPFFTTKETGKGTGLGLYIVKNIISNHKGSIRLENGSHKGAKFIIELEEFNG